MPRLFTALEIPEAVATRLALLQGGLSGARWISPENYHLTLRFFGDVDGADARAIADALSGIGHPAFDVAIDRLDSFGGRRPRALVARARPGQELTALQEANERAARSAGFPAETRKFTPHVTLARLRGVAPMAVAGYLGQRGLLFADPFPVTRFVLFSSRDRIGGGPYVVERAYDLGVPAVTAA